jgi:acetylornithine deacetylase/succinyl-diaminopimelate desuccinylase-like protein
MMTGGTERSLLSDMGVQCYGFWPRRLEAGVPPGRQLNHGVDERVSLDNLVFAARCLFEIVCDLNGIGR